MHIMIDIETLSKKPNAVITQLGAVAFDPITQIIGDAQLWNIDVESSLAAGCVMDASTVLWWMAQDDRAIKGIVEGQKVAGAIGTIMSAFAEWVRAQAAGGLYIWSHGATFDIPIVEWAMRRVCVMPPWPYYNARDTRTLYCLTGEKGFGPAKFHSGVKHDALADSMAQTKAVLEAYRIIGANREYASKPHQLEINT